MKCNSFQAAQILVGQPDRQQGPGLYDLQLFVKVAFARLATNDVPAATLRRMPARRRLPLFVKGYRPAFLSLI
ncbi:MAG: hypothetical protein DME96_14825 [Verrucomicrobia bacterium]|nr:MAG: hypothetical protein DME96_14825 [Verrucomicrobiota bacterium]